MLSCTEAVDCLEGVWTRRVLSKRNMFQKEQTIDLLRVIFLGPPLHFLALLEAPPLHKHGEDKERHIDAGPCKEHSKVLPEEMVWQYPILDDFCSLHILVEGECVAPAVEWIHEIYRQERGCEIGDNPGRRGCKWQGDKMSVK